MIDLQPITATVTVTVWTDEALAAQFRRCEQWQDADQWEALGHLYHQKYPHCMNAGYCWRKADELRQQITAARVDGEALSKKRDRPHVQMSEL